MGKDLDVAGTFHLGDCLAMKLIIVSILNTIYHHRHYFRIFVPPYLEHKTIEFDFFPQYR